MESVLVLGGAEPSPLSGGQKKTAHCGLMLPGNVGRDEPGQRDITALLVHARCALPATADLWGGCVTQATGLSSICLLNSKIIFFKKKRKIPVCH